VLISLNSSVELSAKSAELQHVTAPETPKKLKKKEHNSESTQLPMVKNSTRLRTSC
jgi:hypothetical protein